MRLARQSASLRDAATTWVRPPPQSRHVNPGLGRPELAAALSPVGTTGDVRPNRRLRIRWAGRYIATGMATISSPSHASGGRAVCSLFLVKAVDVVDVERRAAPAGVAGRGEAEVAAQQQQRADDALGGEGPAIVADPPEAGHEQDRQPAVEQAQAADEQRQRRVVHVGRHAQEVAAEGEVGDPQRLRHEDGHRLEAEQEPALPPQAEQRDQQRHVAEVEEVLRPVRVPVVRHEDGDEGRVGHLDRQRDPPCVRHGMIAYANLTAGATADFQLW